MEQYQTVSTLYHLSALIHIPLLLLQLLKEKFKKILSLDVIRKVNEPSEWCYPIVIIQKKNGTIRL